MRKEVAHSFVLESAPVAEDIPVPVKFDWSSSKASDVSINHVCLVTWCVRLDIFSRCFFTVIFV
jgi:hypothetical protein